MSWEHRNFTRQRRRSDEGGGVDHKRLDAELNSLGSEGWELVAAVPVLEDSVFMAASYFLKRLREDAADRHLVGVRR
jgi:hypothetical protein